VLLAFGYKPTIEIPDAWWQDEDDRRILLKQGCKPSGEISDDWWVDTLIWEELFGFGYKPPIKIPDDWWKRILTRKGLLERGYKPPIEISDDWWRDTSIWDKLLGFGYELPSEIPDYWWYDEEIRRLLRRRGYPPPDRYAAEDTQSEDDELGVGSRVSREDNALAGVASPQVPPLLSSGVAPLDVQLTPLTCLAVRMEDDPASNVVAGRRHRGFRDSLKGLFRR